MIGGVQNYLKSYFASLGISEDTLTGRMKARTIRIKICMEGVNLGEYNESTDDSPEVIEKLKNITKNIKL